MAERSHLSIGEVLSLLRDEFPDVTISKIRFLESQGLVDPERTPSGYRKFYDHDVERLRWILRQQREHFLPLKVIRGRLTEQEGGDEDGDANGAEAGDRPAVAAVASPATEAAATAGAAGTARETPAREATPGEAPAREGAGRGAPATPSLFAGLHKDTPEAGAERPSRRQPDGPATPAAEPAGRPAPAAGARTPAPAAPAAAAAGGDGGHDDQSYTVEEMAAAAGTDPALVQELKQYGLIAAQTVVGGVAYYDGAALAVTRAAARFARHGVEARHLRPWRNSADREADLFQQVVLPLLRQRNPQARHQALEALAELASAGAALRSALVERAIRDIR